LVHDQLLVVWNIPKHDSKNLFAATVQCHSGVLDYPFPAKEKKMLGGNDWGARVPILFKPYIFGLYRPSRIQKYML
jgi:hypothetical protein